MGRIIVSKAITSPRLPTSFENVDLYHVQSLRLISWVNQSYNNQLSQHYNTHPSCGSASYLEKPSRASPCPLPSTGAEAAPARLEGWGLFQPQPCGAEKSPSPPFPAESCPTRSQACSAKAEMRSTRAAATAKAQ